MLATLQTNAMFRDKLRRVVEGLISSGDAEFHSISEVAQHLQLNQSYFYNLLNKDRVVRRVTLQRVVHGLGFKLVMNDEDDLSTAVLESMEGNGHAEGSAVVDPLKKLMQAVARGVRESGITLSENEQRQVAEYIEFLHSRHK